MYCPFLWMVPRKRNPPIRAARSPNHHRARRWVTIYRARRGATQRASLPPRLLHRNAHPDPPRHPAFARLRSRNRSWPDGPSRSPRPPRLGIGLAHAHFPVHQRRSRSHGRPRYFFLSRPRLSRTGPRSHRPRLRSSRNFEAEIEPRFHMERRRAALAFSLLTRFWLVLVAAMTARGV